VRGGGLVLNEQDPKSHRAEHQFRGRWSHPLVLLAWKQSSFAGQLSGESPGNPLSRSISDFDGLSSLARAASLYAAELGILGLRNDYQSKFSPAFKIRTPAGEIASDPM
jgi:hypothetical protein